MAPWTTYHIQPKPGAGFHFGLRGLEGEVSGAHCPSDTLFAALIATLAGLEGTVGVTAFVTPFANGQPPFLLTSVFPRAGDLSLFPLPHARLELTPQPGQRKLFKKLCYVSPVILRRILNRRPLDDYVGAGKKGVFLQEGQVWIAAEETAKLPEGWNGNRLREQKVWDHTPVDRVAVDRVSSASNVYRIGRTVYASECGLWFGVQWPGDPDAAWQTQLETLLAHLGDTGLGGERSVGYGQFTYCRATGGLDLPAATPGAPALTLSRYLPAADELPTALRGAASYRLEAVPGWLNAPGQRAQRRKQVRMLVEGAVFQPVGPRPWGRLADARPVGWEAHPIWRYGYACPVGVRPQEVHHA